MTAEQTTETKIDLRNFLPDRFEERMAAANEALMAGAEMLRLLQGSSFRDPEAEASVAQGYASSVRGLSMGIAFMNLQATLGDIESDGIMQRVRTDTELEGNNSRRSILHRSIKPVEIAAALPHEGTKIEGPIFFDGFKTGEQLGLPNTDRWYLVAGWGIEYYFPVDGLKNVRIAIRDVGL